MATAIAMVVPALCKRTGHSCSSTQLGRSLSFGEKAIGMEAIVFGARRTRGTSQGIRYC
jgi:hypothetical protein